jgi:hypothetical protein
MRCSSAACSGGEAGAASRDRLVHGENEKTRRLISERVFGPIALAGFVKRPQADLKSALQ